MQHKDKAVFKVEMETANVFDMLAILEVKETEVQGVKGIAAAKQAQKLQKELSDFLGEQLLQEILHSEIYESLFNANYDLFKEIERVREGEDIKAKYLDDLNMDRFSAKKTLQEVFFSPFTEVKTKC